MASFKKMSDWRNHVDHFFSGHFWNEVENIIKPTIPQINIYQYDHELICVACIPGLTDPNQIAIFCNHTLLEIKGVIDIGFKGGKVIKEEIVQGVFERRIALPFPVKQDKINVSYQNGLVVIRLFRLRSL
ncbi:Hsp20/alpha crystallin family protein [Lentibacillus amyloliquefaciens]|uniref:Heat-shock protein Hsp20 n=1 Tax=Lentibacillus amyloliquefaciens TaxID=1472767 RepID=A0A0U4F0N4_9BACI|nr:Hsp20/alpha crystallin family protein [Lentibacillus amyloliquefaciens]ALX49063.1 heat-shock protein Hsp20 [Lentibacillus amyloliquefaciens]